MLTIPITLKKIYFLTKFCIFCKGLHHVFFAKNGKNLKFLGFNANGLEIKLRAQRGMTFLILTICCIMPAKTKIFYDNKCKI